MAKTLSPNDRAAHDRAADVDGVPAASDDPADYLAPTFYLDFDDPAVTAYAAEKTAGADDPTAKAIALFYAVRDDIRYDPYALEMTRDAFKASRTLAERAGWCVEKGALMAACCRAVGIPARVGYADVRNHLSTQTLSELMGTNLFTYHGYASLWLAGRWVKVTPVFDKPLCDKFGVKTQEFDGRDDALFQEYNHAGARHMSYENDRGAYTDVPVAEIMADFDQRYPKFMAALRSGVRPGKGDFATQARMERRAES